MAGFAGLSVVALYLVSDRIDAFAFAPTGGTVRDRIADMRSTLPADQSDGTVLEDVEFDGRRVTLAFTGDERIDIRMVRDADRDSRCKLWRKALRSREISSVEYRYRLQGSSTSMFLDRTVCG
ncbi:hypothetical protein [Aureimonas sp. AU12]|uniref:hypothetical protein n=1 Tax=Aureimonas sp. AU12 TaxID=1638161 RepID=UPI00078573A4|nr:hypothetical protein [Aureimonas sp. AU12]